MPWITDVAVSDLFMEDLGEEKNLRSSLNEMTSNAYKQCNLHISDEILTEGQLNFPNEPLNAFSLGNYQYVINSDVELSSTEGTTTVKRYACRIKFNSSSDDILDSNNWHIEGISGLD